MYSIDNFKSDIKLRLRRWTKYENASMELTTIANALSTDPRVHDQTITKPMSQIEIKGTAQTPFTNDVNHIVNKGKAGNLTGSQMANVLAGLGGAPTNFSPPVISGPGTTGTNLTCAPGQWTNFPNSYTYQWTRSGTSIAGATGLVYALVGADEGNAVACVETATNEQGSASTQSNSITAKA